MEVIKDFLKNTLKFRNIYKKYKKELYLFLIMDFICILTLIVSPTLMSCVLSSIVKRKYNNILIYLLLLVLMKVMFVVLSFLSTKVFLLFKKNVSYDFKNKVSRSIIGQNLEVFNKFKKGKFINRIVEDLDNLSNYITYIRDYSKVLITNLLTIFFIIYLNRIIGFIYLISLFLMIYLKSIGIKYKNYYYKKSLLVKEKTSTDIQEVYNGIQDVKLLNLSDFFNNKISNNFYDSENYQYRADFFNNLFYILSRIIEWLTTSIVIFIGIFLIEKKLLSMDNFITIFLFRNIIFSVDGCISDLILKISLFNLSCDRVFELGIDDKKDNYIKYNDCKGRVEFRNVSFRYKKNWVLKDCSFVLKENGFYLLMGNSGCGKSTLLNLLMKLYEINSGCIFIDDYNISNVDKNYIFENISIISQNYYLFDMSIRDNLLLSRDDIEEDEMIKVCKDVGIHEEIMKLDKKYDTMMGEGAKFLSGGQKQRIAIARCILMNRKILLFDEATSSLDSSLEERIFELAQKLRRNHTIIWVSHNKEEKRKADNVLVLKDGKIEWEKKDGE